MINEHDCVVLTQDFPGEGLKAGDKVVVKGNYLLLQQSKAE